MNMIIRFLLLPLTLTLVVLACAAGTALVMCLAVVLAFNNGPLRLDKTLVKEEDVNAAPSPIKH